MVTKTDHASQKTQRHVSTSDMWVTNVFVNLDLKEETAKLVSRILNCEN